jgi:hypothetical protein
MEIEKTDVTHIIRTHLEGKPHQIHISTLELSKDHIHWFIVSRIGTLQEDLKNTKWEE